MYQRVCIALQGHRRRNSTLRDIFERRFQHLVCTYHWILPYPHNDGLLQTVKPWGHRMWFSIVPSSSFRGPVWECPVKEWRWGENRHHDGQMPAIPSYLAEDKEAWKKELARLVGYEDEETEDVRPGQGGRPGVDPS